MGGRAELAGYLGDPSKARVDVPAEDDPRAEDENDHGDPRIERWARGLEPFGPEVCAGAARACTLLVFPAWEAELPEDRVVSDALACAATGSSAERREALEALDAAEARRLARWAHLHDILRAARCAVAAAAEPARAAVEVELAALYAFRVVAWSASKARDYSIGLAALWKQLLSDRRFDQEVTRATEDADAVRQMVRIAVADALGRR